MSEGDKKVAEQSAAGAASAAETGKGKDQLSELMASPPTGGGGGTSGGGSGTAGVDVEHQALAAAEAALQQGQRALEQARAQIAGKPGAPAPAPAAGSRRRGLVLKILLAINVAAMIAVASLPMPRRNPSAIPDEPAGEHHGPPAHDAEPRVPRRDDPVIAAFAAADRGDYRGAIGLLEDYLQEVPRLDPGRKANVLLALEHYCSQIGDFTKAQEYQRKTEALRSSHSLPEDLVAMAREAEKNGDVESMRRQYARLLLQQRQIPSALYRHVAEAYLELGDSYRQEADQAAEAARAEELRQLRERLRKQAAEGTVK